MGISNFERMLQLADDVFAVKNDPDQLDVNQDVLDQLRRMGPAHTYHARVDGPIPQPQHFREGVI